eukprot:8549190-Ditylum_brightwellii.AAC.1
MLCYGVEDSVDGGDNHLTHLTQVVGCCLKPIKEQNACSPNITKNRSVLYDSMKSTDAEEEDDGVDGCVDDCFNGCVNGRVDCCAGKEDGVEDSADGGDNHLTHLRLVPHELVAITAFFVL